jgi:ABC-type sugar transport system permease subunit
MTETKPKEKRIFKASAKQTVFIALMLAYPLANTLIFYFGVNINSILMAFQRTDANFDSAWVGIDNFKRVIDMVKAEGALFKYAGNSLFFFLMTFIIGFPLNMLFAYMFYLKMRGTPFFRFCILLPAMISGLVTAMLYSKFAENALPMLFDRWFGIETVSILLDDRFNKWFMLIYMLFTGFSYNVIIYTNAANAINDSILESARIDGATNLQILYRMVMPCIYPTITTFIVVGVAAIFSNQAGAFLFYEYSGPDNITTTGYYMFLMSKKTTMLDYSFAAALGLICTLITFPLTMLVRGILEKFDPMRDAV